MPPTSAFSLVDGGPLCRLMRRLGWTHADGRLDYGRACLVFLGVTWLPLLAMAAVARLQSHQHLLIDWSVHTRLLIAIPLLLRADVSLHTRTRAVVERFVADRWAPGEMDRFDRIVEIAARRRDAAAPEIILLGVALIASELVVWNLGGMPFGARRVVMDRQLIAARWWYALVALPLFQFLVYRALWHWTIWVRLLWRVSRLHLRPIPTHPDLAGGLEFLSRPSTGFAWVVAALSAAQSGVWADQVLHAGVEVTALKTPALVLVVASLILAFGPLIAVAGQLWRCQFEGRDQYGALATDYTRQFHARWIEGRERDGLLGSADIQSLADLANSYNVIDRMRFLPFGARAFVAVAAAALLPMLPVALLGVPLPQLLLKLGGALIGKPG